MIHILVDSAADFSKKEIEKKRNPFSSAASKFSRRAVFGRSELRKR